MTQLVILGSVFVGFAAIVGTVFLAGRRSGVNAVESDICRETASVLRREQEAVAKAPQSKEAVIDRLRNGGGL